MEDKTSASPKHVGSRKIFSVNEEEIIGKFLISCWKKKLRVPHEILYEALQKHLEKYPRPSKCKDNRPSSIWRMKFFERNPSVQEAYTTYKASASRNYDLVSDQLIASFLQDLALAEMPSTVKMPSSSGPASSKAEMHGLGDSQFVQKVDQDIKRGILNIDKKKKKRHSMSAKPAPPSSESDGSAVVAPPSTSKKHKRSKTVGLPSTKAHGSGPGQAEATKTKEKQRKSISLKLSPALFVAGKPSAKTDYDAVASDVKQIDAVGKKEKLTKKSSTESPASKGTKQVMPNDAVPLEPVKFEEGANIEAMDCGKWYKAKIVEVDHGKKEILVHFNGWGKRFDTVFPMTSALIRGITQLEKKQEAIKFKVGDDVLSQWSDGNFYPGTVMALRESGSYVVMFYDGLKKLVRPGMLKPITEKEKEASLKAAQKAYLMSLQTTAVEVQPKPLATSGQRRYRTSATDRGKRISARLSSDDSSAPSAPPSAPSAPPAAPKRAKKRKLEEPSAEPKGEGEPPDGDVTASPGSQPERFQAKKARLDKITGTLLDKVTTAEMTSTASATATTSVAGDKGATETTSSTGVAMVTEAADVPSPQRDVTFSYDDSDGSDVPLVIDEDRDGKLPKLKKSAKAKQVTKPESSSRKKVAQKVSNVQISSTSSKPVDENLQKLADAALSVSSAVSSDDNAQTPASPLTGKKRKEASEALLQLSLSSYPSDKPASDDQTEKTVAAAQVKSPKDLTDPEKLDVAVGRVLKGGLSLAEAAEQLDVNVAQLRETLLQRPGIISGSSTPQFMSVPEEDDVINWIHDVTDLGWGISDAHICNRIKLFLAEHSYSVVFNNASPVNYPSKTWLSGFLERHPEIFPGRKRPLARFRCDREGFEDWLVRWLAMLRSYEIYPNSVYYCDELVWDASPKLLHDVRFTHGGAALEMGALKSKITTLTCVGANGEALPTFHVFPENSSGEMDEGTKLGPNAALANSGTLSSDLFHHWLKHNFIPNAAPHRPAALLLDWRLDEVGFDVLRLAEENQIVLFRFLPTAAHFLQHPDQKLFGRLRQQWKKSLVSKFMKQNTSKETSTAEFAKFFNEEFRQVATPSTVKMCYELTKLYTPISESEILASKRESKVSKDKRNKRKRSKPVAYVGEETSADVQPHVSEATEEDTTLKATDKAAPQEAVGIVNEEEMQEDKGSSVLNDSNATDMSSLSSELETPTATKKAETGAEMLKAPEASSLPLKKGFYKKGETVLAKWSDCRLYLATILKRLDEDRYKIRYFDGLVKTVKDDFLRPWTGTMPAMPPVPSKQAPKTLVATSPAKEERGRGMRVKKKTEIAKAASMKRRKSTPGAAITGVKKTSAPSAAGGGNSAAIVPQTVFTPPDQRITYKRGETVLCRWTNRRMYPATVLRQVDEDHYLVKYYDERKKVVKYTWLSPWKPTTAQQATSTPVVSVADDAKGSAATTKPTKPKLVDARTPSVVIAKVKVPAHLESGAVASDRESEDLAEIKEGEGKAGKEESPLQEEGAAETGEQEKETEVDDALDAYGFKIGDTVLARWTDCRSYPATLLQRYDDGQYEVQYYDGMKSKVKPSLLTKWDPSAVPRPLARQRKRTASGQVEKPPGEPSATTESSEGQQQSSASTNKPVLGVAQGHIPKAPFHKDFVVESELNRFKCRVPGCNKVFRKESVLQQHHRHYHLQRYKLRDQETPIPPKRKASKDDSTATKRRVSADYYSAMSPRPDAGPSFAEGARSRGGKPPIDRMKMTSMGMSSSSAEERSVLSPNDSAVAGGEAAGVEKPPQNKSKRKRSGASPHGSQDAMEDEGASGPDAGPSRGSVEIVNEDIIQCVCGEEEEEGFMLQCESCFTWQHAVCEGISPPPGSDEGSPEGPKVPQGYVCTTCRDPPGVRRSQQYLYNNDFLTKGKLPSLTKLDDDVEANLQESGKEKAFEQIMMVTNRLMDEVGKIQEALHGIRLKIDVADPAKDHPLIRLWRDVELPVEAKESRKDEVNTTTDVAMKEDQSKVENAKGEAEVHEENGAVTTSVFQTVKTVLMRIVKSVTGEISPTRDDRETAPESVNDAQEKMDVDEGSEVAENKETETETAEPAPPAEKKEPVDDKTAEEKRKEDLWKPIEIKRTLVALGDMTKKELESDAKAEEILKSRSNLLSLIKHLEDSLDERIAKLTEYVTAAEAAFERLEEPSSPVNGGESATTLNDNRLGELQSDIGAIHNSLDAVQRLLTLNA